MASQSSSADPETIPDTEHAPTEVPPIPIEQNEDSGPHNDDYLNGLDVSDYAFFNTSDFVLSLP